MTILLTGGTGNTATALARQLKAAGLPFLATSRKARLNNADLQDVAVAELDFSNAETFDKPFQHPAVLASPIRALYTLVPGEADPASVNAFVDHAISRKVSRVVLLGGQGADMDAPYPFSRVWKHLDEKGVEYAVLQPSWFNGKEIQLMMYRTNWATENLFKHYYLHGIKTENKLYSGTGDGKMGFVAVDDIAASALALLTSQPRLNGEAYLIMGPEILTHDEIAERLSQRLSRKIEHVRVPQEDRHKQLVSLGVTDQRAKFNAFLEVLIGKGISAQGFPSNNILNLTRREPMNFHEWIEKHKDRFQEGF